MAAATSTLIVLRTGLSKLIGDYWSTNPTSGSSTSAYADTKLGYYPTKWFEGYWSLLRPGASRNISRVATFTTTTGAITVVPAHDIQPTTAMTYELHRYDPTLKTEALNEAAVELYRYLFLEDHDQAVTTALNQWQYTPTSDILNVRQIKIQQDQTYSDYPYRELYRGRDWEWRDNEGVRVIQFKIQPPTSTPALKLEIVHVKPLETLSADTDTMTISDQDDLRLLYTMAASILFHKIAHQSIGRAFGDFQKLEQDYHHKAERLKAKFRKRWPKDMYYPEIGDSPSRFYW